MRYYLLAAVLLCGHPSPFHISHTNHVPLPFIHWIDRAAYLLAMRRFGPVTCTCCLRQHRFPPPAGQIPEKTHRDYQVQTSATKGLEEQDTMRCP